MSEIVLGALIVGKVRELGMTHVKSGKAAQVAQPIQVAWLITTLPNPTLRWNALVRHALGRPRHPRLQRISVKHVMPPRDTADAPPGRNPVHLLDTLKPGDLVDLRPLDRVLTLDARPPQPVVFMASGAGINRFLSMLESAAHVGGEREIWLFFGVRNGRERTFRDYLKTFEDKLPHCYLVACYANPDEGDV